MLLSLVIPSTSFAQSNEVSRSLKNTSESAQTKISNSLTKEFSKDDKVTFLVKFKEKAEVEKIAKDAITSAQKNGLSSVNVEYAQRSAVISELKYTALTTQDNVKQFLDKMVEEGSVSDYESYYIVNALAVTATKEVAEQIAQFMEVEKLLPNEKRKLIEATVDKEAEAIQSEVQNIEWNVERVGAPDVWNMGIDGSGIVVGAIDTGTQWEHPALMEKYRGYDAATGEVDHTYSFFDAVNGRAAAYDDQGHGTHVTGTMVGSEPSGANQIGVAPGAKFIHAKALDAGGYGTDTGLLAAAEWMLAPGGDITKAPDVVNNSWGGGSGLDEWYRDVVTAWRAADIFPEFSAGNTTLTNPGGPGSVAVPANYPESFATGATDANNNLASFSLLGPSPYGEIKPEISAPGVNIRSSVPGSGYEGGWNGTSMAGPAVSGVVALILQVNSNLSVDDVEEILTNTATPLTSTQYPDSPNNGFGYGLVNAFDAVSSIMDGLGTIEGSVTMEGEDTEAPVFEHTPFEEVYSDMDLDLTFLASDNISVTSVTVDYVNENGVEGSVEATRTAGDFRSGSFVATIPGEDIVEGELSYTVTVNDFGNNTVTSEPYTTNVAAGISVGYSADFESEPVGWSSYGDNNSWARGIPTSGPGEAASGEYVFATNPTGTYNNNENSTLLMPPIDLPEGNAYLQFDHWYNIENNWDFAHVFISTDMQQWTQALRLTNVQDQWSPVEVDLSQYAGERIYIAFNLDTDGSVVRDGWYIDNVALSDTSLDIEEPAASITIPKATAKEKKAEKVDPNKIQPDFTKNDQVQLIENEVSNLPLSAKVTVLENGRSVSTNPADGSFSFVHAAGDFTLVAESYGFRSEEQAVTVEADQVSQANFVLEELPKATITGTISSANSGEAIEGATLFLVEDANVTPVQTAADGSYSLTAYEGTYTLKVAARGYIGTEVEVNFDEDKEVNIELEPLFTYPGGEIGYDDGSAENARAYYDAGNKWAVRMSLPEGQDEAIVTEGVFQFHGTDWPSPGATEFAVEVWDASGPDGTPGEKLAGPINAEAIRDLNQWTVVDLREENIQVSGDFYMVYVQTGINPNVPGLATDESGPNAERSFQSVAGAWSPSPTSEGNYMIRARVDYAVQNVAITSPSDGFLTNEPSIEVAGTASPTTTIALQNNGEEVAEVTIGDDGTFTIPVTLTEGENELQAVNYVNGEQANESDAITVTLDTEAPELTIDSPTNGEKINRETVTVEGTVADAHLDYVEVNGQKATVTDGRYSKRILLDEGSNEIEVVASDLAGNSQSESITVEVDYTAPTISNLTPTEDRDVSVGQTVVIEFDSEPNLRAKFSILMPLTDFGIQNATELPMMETSDGHYIGYWTVPNKVEGNGAVIEVTVTDSFGNVTRERAEGKLNIGKKGNGKGNDNGNGNGNGNGKSTGKN
ncbi:S8 family serine peptidase [Robertmurraya massiliosenegalensis]|uniref:S8 family serine peptidase n=1 Tax=Robertmurraya massiliosenegalensis TaxID=1287657 RepID=UPI00068463FB|nr:S8 family serine peptidase [Robertmurraya massiliosenegalensis]